METAIQEFPKIISVDDHVVEPPHLFTTWLPAKFLDRAPRIVRRGFSVFEFGHIPKVVFDDDAAMQGDCWVYEDLVLPHKRISAAVGFAREDMTMTPITYEEMRPGCYDPVARLEDMDLMWEEASLCFPTFPRFCGQTFSEAKDKDLALACVRAYNDWMVEEWCAGSGGRLIPLVIIPLWDVQLAVAEVRRNAARGVHNVCFSEIPAKLGLPSIHCGYWEPFFAACAENEMTISMHIGSSSLMPFTSADAPPAVSSTAAFTNVVQSMTDFLVSGILVRHPDLYLAYSEGQIGWIPYVLQRADDVWLECRGYGGVADLVPEPPSTYYYRQMFGCVFRDQFGIESLRLVGEDNVAFETDYPHTDSTWPHTKKIAEEMTAKLDAETTWKVMRGNAIRMLRLDLPR